MANGPIIEEAPTTSGNGLGGFAGGAGGAEVAAGLAGVPSATSHSGVQGAGGTAHPAAGGAPMIISSTAVPAPSEAAAAAFNAAAAAAVAAGTSGAPGFVQLPAMMPVPTVGGGAAGAPGGMAQLPTTDNNPIVELPELDGLGLGGPVDLDLADMLPPLSPAAADLLLPTEQPSLGSDFWNGLIASPTASQMGASDVAPPAVPAGMVPLDAAFPKPQP